MTESESYSWQFPFKPWETKGPQNLPGDLRINRKVGTEGKYLGRIHKVWEALLLVVCLFLGIQM